MTIKDIVDKYDLNEENIFSADEVQAMMLDFDQSNDSSKSIRRNLLILPTLLLLAIAAIASQNRGLNFSNSNRSVINDQKAQKIYELVPTTISEADTVNHRELENFEKWVECEAIATVPIKYLEGEKGKKDETIFLCNPPEGVCESTPPPSSSPKGKGKDKGKDKGKTDSPTSFPTSSSPTYSPTSSSPTYSPTSSSPTHFPTSSSPTATSSPTTTPPGKGNEKGKNPNTHNEKGKNPNTGNEKGKNPVSNNEKGNGKGD